MIELGRYQAEDGEIYDCVFYPEDKIAEASGPLPKGDQIGARGVAFTVKAKSPEEARKKLAATIGPGRFV